MRDAPLAEHTRWKIGGPAPALGRAGSEEELRQLLAELETDEVPLVLGLGANLLVADEGPGAPVLILEGEFRRFEVGTETIRCGAAAPISAVVQAARREARSGLWILEAVPGTMGGALRMNAGTAAEGIWSRVSWAEIMRRDGNTARLRAEDVHPRYRQIDLAPGAIFLQTEVHAPPGEAEQIEEEHLRRRRAKLEAQVYDQPTCGSVWKNPEPPAPSAWQLVDRVGMRGARCGGACISAKHANFIVNLGGARASDVIDLMRKTRERVADATDIWLEPEIQFWGFPVGTLREVGAVE